MIITFCLFILVSCNKLHTCIGIDEGKYSGYGLIFYHKPVTGSSYEQIIVPTCNDSSALIEKIKNSGKLVKVIGVSIGMNSKNTLFEGINKNSEKLRLLNNDRLAPEFRVVYVCPVYIQFENAENDTKLVTHLSSDILSENMVLQDGSEILLKYFITTEVQIKELRVLQ